MRPALVFINGAGSPDPWGYGFSADVVRSLIFDRDAADVPAWNDVLGQFRGDDQVSKRFDVYGIAYPALAFPMGNSVKIGIDNTVATILAFIVLGRKVVLAGYSEGSLVMNHVWRDEILNPNGRLHAYLPYIVGIILFGDPMRSPGIANGNVRAGFAVPPPVFGYVSGGISGINDLTPAQTPDFLMSCTNPGDMYGDAPTGATPWVKETKPGHDERIIYELVQTFNVANIIAIVEAVVPILNPAADIAGLIAELPTMLTGLFGSGISALPADASNADIVGFIEALLNSGLFFVIKGLSPHMDYTKMVPAMVDFALEAAA